MSKSKTIDPRIKLILLPITAFMSFFVGETYLLLPFIIFIVFLFYLSSMYHKAFQSLFVFCMILVSERIVIFLDNPKLIFIYFMLMFFISRMFIISLFGTYIVRTTKVSEMVYALEKMKIPNGIAIAFSVLLRFAPTMRSEVRALKENMKVRGVINTNFFALMHPIKYLEYSFVPLLMRAVKLSDELSASALIRGLDIKQERVSLIELKLNKTDIFISFLAIMVILIIIIFENII